MAHTMMSSPRITVGLDLGDGELDRAMVLRREVFARGRAFDASLHADFDLEPLDGHPPFEEFRRPKG